MRAIIFTAASFVAALTTSAFSADAVMEEPVATSFNWTGAYIGLEAGYSWAKSKADYTAFLAIDAPMDPKGFVGGIYGGYNFQLGNSVVLGIEGDINYADVHGSTPTLEGGVPIAGQSFDGKVDWTASIRGRVGYSINRFLPYVTAGGAFAHYDVGNTAGGVTEHAFDRTLSGWTVGVGADYAFTDNLIGRVEYRYADFGTKSAGAVLFENYDVDLKTNDLRIGLAYKF